MAGRPRLGLALSGGGFRAAFFHLGVLRRLAELDLLRQVSVLSTVSGGSVVGGLYMLHLARLLGKEPKLARNDYVSLVADVEKEFRAGTAADLRSRLLLDPLQNLRMLCSGFPLGRRLAGLFQKRLYGSAARRVKQAWSRGVPLEAFRIEPGGKPLGAEIEAYNAGDADRLPKWVINATCLNTGRAFRFSPSEVGDPVLGSLRFDEAATILAYKGLQRSGWSVRGAAKVIAGLRDRELEQKPTFRERTSRHFAWWLALQDGLRAEAARPAEPGAGEAAFRARFAALKGSLTQVGTWLDVFLEGDWDAARRLAGADFRLLRRAKVAAWYLRDGARAQPPVTGGAAPEAHVRRLWSAFEDVDVPMAQRMRQGAPSQGDGVAELAELALDLFYLRSAEAFAWTAARAAARLTVADAVAASASFPPVFAPFQVHELYDPGRVWRLALTDGGVYDNIGLDALNDEECTHVIASDAGQLLPVEAVPAAGRLAAATRIANVLLATERDRLLAGLREQRRVSDAAAEATFCKGPRMTEMRARYRLEALVFFHMTSNPNDGAPDGMPPHPYAEDIARLRTDLDAFHPDEIEALIYQGYQLGDRFVRRYLGAAFPYDQTPPKSLPPKLRAGVPLLNTRATIRAGRMRLLRVFLQQPTLLALSVILLMAGLAALWTYVAFPLSSVGAWIVDATDRFARWPLLVGGYELLVDDPKSGWIALIVLLVLGWLWIRWPAFEMALARRLTPITPRLVHVALTRTMRLVGLWRRNIFWLVGFAPLVLALLASAGSAGSWVMGRLNRR